MIETPILLEVLNTQRLPDFGYVIRTELIKYPQKAEPIQIKSAYNLKGELIGSPEDAYFLCRKLGIKPETRTPDLNTCTIGFCKKEQKWYGWSHRAYYGFGIGDIAEDGNAGVISEAAAKGIDVEQPRIIAGFQAKTLEDAKTMAIAFAECVS